MSKITVTVQLGRGYGESETVCIDVDDYIVDELSTSLRLSDGALPFLDTPDAVVQRVRKLRANAAADLSRDMTKALLAAFAKRDTFNGYSRAKIAAWADSSPPTAGTDPAPYG